jgi:hypothetical protein
MSGSTPWTNAALREREVKVAELRRRQFDLLPEPRRDIGG